MTSHNGNAHLKIDLPNEFVDQQLTTDQEAKIGNTIQSLDNPLTEKDYLLNNVCHWPEEIEEQLTDATTVDQESSVRNTPSDNCYTEKDNLSDNNSHLLEEIDAERLTDRNEIDETNVVLQKYQNSSSECDLLAGSEGKDICCLFYCFQLWYTCMSNKYIRKKVSANLSISVIIYHKRINAISF